MRTAAAATRRVANRLSDAGVQTQILTAAEISSATDELMDGVRPENLAGTRFACHDAHVELRTFEITTPSVTTVGISRVWTVPSHSTTLCVSLRRGEYGGSFALRGLARFGSYGGTGNAFDLALLQREQQSALACTLPPQRHLGRCVNGAFGAGKGPTGSEVACVRMWSSDRSRRTRPGRGAR